MSRLRWERGRFKTSVEKLTKSEVSLYPLSVFEKYVERTIGRRYEDIMWLIEGSISLELNSKDSSEPLVK